MAEAELSILLSLKDSFSEQFKNFQQQIEESKKDIETFSKAAVAFGASIFAAMGLAVNAAENEREAMARLAQTLANTGTNYYDVKSQIESVTTSLMQNTNYGINAQLAALNKLTIFTKDYYVAIQALPIALDLASAANIDVSMAARLVGDAYEGTSTRLKTFYGIDIPKGVSGLAALAILERQVADEAKATASPFTIMRNEITDLASSVGKLLTPEVSQLIGYINKCIEATVQWTEQHSTLTKWLSTTALAVGTLATGVGLLGLAITSTLIPRLLAGAAALATYIASLWATVAAQVAVYASMGPVGWAIIGGMAAAGAGGVYALYSLGKSVMGGIESTPAVPSYQLGGIVPGPTGQPVPIIAHGGEKYLGSGSPGGNIYNLTVNAGYVDNPMKFAQFLREQLFYIDRASGGTGIKQ